MELQTEKLKKNMYSYYFEKLKSEGKGSSLNNTRKEMIHKFLNEKMSGFNNNEQLLDSADVLAKKNQRRNIKTSHAAERSLN